MSSREYCFHKMHLLLGGIPPWFHLSQLSCMIPAGFKQQIILIGKVVAEEGLMFRDKSREILRHAKYTNCQLTATIKNRNIFLPYK